MRGPLVWAAVATASLATAMPLGAEVKDQAANGFTVENTQLVPVAPDVAWRGLIDVGRWWPADHRWWGRAANLTIDPVAGGCFCEVDGARQARHMQVVFVEPGKLLRMTGGLGPLQGMGWDGVLEFRLAAEGQGTRITLWYRAGGYAPDDLTALAAVVDRVQAGQLLGLAEYLGPGAAPAPKAQKLMNRPPLTGTLAPVR